MTAEDEEDMDLGKVYSIMRDICKLKRACLSLPPSLLRPPSLTSPPQRATDVQKFILVHLVTKLGTAASDAATSLKLLEKGLRKEDLALAVLIDFPFQILFGYLAARWSKGPRPLRPWMVAMWTRLGWAAVSMALIAKFPRGEEIGTAYFALVVLCTVGSSFSRCVSPLAWFRLSAPAPGSGAARDPGSRG